MGELLSKGNVGQRDEPTNDARTKFRRMDLEAKFDVAYLDEELNISWLKKKYIPNDTKPYLLIQQQAFWRQMI